MERIIIILEAIEELLGERGGQVVDVATHPYVVFSLPFAVLLGLFNHPNESIREFFCFLISVLIWPLPSTPDYLKLAYLFDVLSQNTGGIIEAGTFSAVARYMCEVAILGSGIKIWKLVKW